MDIHRKQLVRLGELLNVSAGVLRDLLEARDFDGESDNLADVAAELNRLAAKVKHVGSFAEPLDSFHGAESARRPGKSGKCAPH